MTLSELLEALCKANPERFRMTPLSFADVKLSGGWNFVDDEHPTTYPIVEQGIREAIEARDWEWCISKDDVYHASVTMGRGETYKAFDYCWDVPVFALGMAYLKALGVEV